MAEAKKVSKKPTTKKAVAKNADKTAEKPKTSKKAAETIKQAEKLAVAETTEKIENLAETEAIADAIVEAEAKIIKEEKATAKAGKRSHKAIVEATELAAKEERKKHAEEQENQAKKPIIKVRSKLERRGKNYRNMAKSIDSEKIYSLKEASDLIVKTNPVKFDATVELHVRLGVDPKQADQNIRANLVLPAGTGKNIKVAVYADPEKLEGAKKAGADICEADSLLQQFDKGIVDFDVLIATPSVMPKLGKYAKLLGPKGLMPNPKSGTVTNDIAKAVKEAKAGKIEYRVDSTGIVHVASGKVSFGGQKILENLRAIIDSVKNSKPSSVKGTYFRSAYLTTSMGPSIKIDISEF